MNPKIIKEVIVDNASKGLDWSTNAEKLLNEGIDISPGSYADMALRKIYDIEQQHNEQINQNVSR